MRRKVAIIGTGVSGMAAAWLLSQRHLVTVYERDERVGGHCNTVVVDGPDGAIPVDTGFIVYNELTYPNLTALFDHLDVATHPTEMSLAVSVGDGELEYSGSSFAGLLAQKRNLVRPRFWSMLRDLRRFYREAPRDLAALESTGATLGAYLEDNAYGAAFQEDHLLPMAGAIWSASFGTIRAFPAASLIRFLENHGLLSLHERPQWRSVTGGSRSYVERLTRSYAHRIRRGAAARAIRRAGNRVQVTAGTGEVESFDAIVVATHADQALALLDDPTREERRVLGAFRYGRNKAVLHSDPSFMPRRRATWSSWNHIGHDRETDGRPTVTYWMNALQRLPTDMNLFVTLNPGRRLADILHEVSYDHPIFDAAATSAQRHLWSLQGQRNTWFCGAYFGAGFHEDGLQAGLAAAESLGRVRRPWRVPNESGRIFLPVGATRVAA